MPNTKLLQFPLLTTAGGGAGTSTGTVRMGCPSGRLLAIALDGTGLPATADITVTATHPMAKAVFTRANSGADLTLTPVVEQALDGAGGAAAAGWFQHPAVRGELVLDVAQADVGNTLRAWCLVEVE